MTESAIIRRAKITDQVQIGDLWRAFLVEQGHMDSRVMPSNDALLRWKNDFPTWIRDESRRIFIAEEDGILQGFITALQWAPPPIYMDCSEVYINELYVVPHNRGCGIGTRLFYAVKGWTLSTAAVRIRLRMLASNKRGEHFWKKLSALPFSITMTIEMEKEAPAV